MILAVGQRFSLILHAGFVVTGIGWVRLHEPAAVNGGSASANF
jgi:hypothetical protein